MGQTGVTLQQMLDARERRSRRQRAMLNQLSGGAGCLLCLTMNIAGAVKRTPLIRLLFDEGVRLFKDLHIPVLSRQVLDEQTGPEAFWLVAAGAEEVKQAARRLEDRFPAARLFDFDVLDGDGQKLSRPAARACLICGGPAALCARSRRHGLPALQEATERLLRDFVGEQLARCAHSALLGELYTTPKPGLVDRSNCGAHSDMDLPLFEASARSLYPYFVEAAKLGMAACEPEGLRQAGREGEAAMFSATGGVNTHKGMVYSMGLLLYGMGKALTSGGDACLLAGAMARADELEAPRRGPASTTNGGRVRARYGVGGILEEAAAGFPHGQFASRRIAFYRRLGASNPEALTLCDLMAELEDTNLLHRGGWEGLTFVRSRAKAIGTRPVTEREQALWELDRELITRRLSPGGSADMLALGLFLCSWEKLSSSLF